MLRTQSRRKTSRFIPLFLALFTVLGMRGNAPGAEPTEERFEVKVNRATDRTVVYRIANDQRTQWYWIPGDLGQTFLSRDGQYLASCEPWLDSGYRGKNVVIRFYRFGSPLSDLRLRDLLKKFKKLDQAGSRFQWGQCSGFTDKTTFEIHTVEAKRITYNVSTMRMQSSAGAWPPDLETSSFPNPCEVTDLLCDRFIDYVAGWRQVRGKWEYITDADDDDRLLHQRSDHWREGNAIMYFDNLSVADADIQTLLKMDLEFPQLVLDEDDARVRRLRRFAGAGLVFRLLDENNYYMFRLAGEEGAVLGKMVNGKWIDLANPRAIDFLYGNLRFRDRWYELRVRIRDDLIQCWITEWTVEGDALARREQAVVSLRDGTFSKGKAGLVTFEAKAQFSHFRITDVR